MVFEIMHLWYLAYNPLNGEGCYITCIGSTGDKVLEDDQQLIKAFLEKNSECIMEFSSGDELSDKLHDNGGILLNRMSQEQKDNYINGKPLYVTEINELIEDGTLSRYYAKKVLGESLRTGKLPREIVAEQGLGHLITDNVPSAVNRIYLDYPDQIESLKSGQEDVLNYLIGQAMIITHGRANPELIKKALLEKIKNER